MKKKKLFTRFTRATGILLLMIFPLFLMAQGVYYQIKIGPMAAPASDEITTYFTKIDTRKDKEGLYTCRAGSYKTYDQASEMEQKIREVGDAPVEVEAYFNKMKISLQDALAMEGDQNQYDQEDAFSMDKLTSMIQSGEKPQLHYAVAIDIESCEDTDALFQYLDALAVKVRKEGESMYLIGEYKTMKQAKAERIKLDRADVANVIIIAYVNDERISAMKAGELEALLKDVSVEEMVKE